MKSYVKSFDQDKMEKAQRLTAEVCYRDDRPFTLWHTPAMCAFLECLNPAFKPPAVTSIRRELLEESYEKYSNKVNENMKHEDQLAFSSDGSTDSRNRGVTNLSVVTPLTGSYVLETE
jgi:hypothetical protein